ncbi:prepilin peptidase [Aliikangiella marina]|uniref:Prepilin leader peptidase/N-methyltransferase n=1 Tax=Aliikangiella marina TaxID=1712262 RepID=A0A545T2D2_9GAMM|nr:A24 family peptidase [Aliikangiella marina]TQV71380.1 prepilin peptidase [Aliikangiella marina]
MNDIVAVFQAFPVVLTGTCIVFGLLLGSFLNVVIFRYPIMLFREWESMAKDVLQERGFSLIPPKEPIDKQPEKFNLVVPRSACPKCGHKITAIENIPIISYLFLKGKCRNCKTPISIRYPVIEVITGLTFGLCAYHFGFGYPLLVALLVTAYFISMSFIDIDHQILPDTMTLPLLWLALVIAIFEVYIPLTDALIGAAAGYLCLWSIYWLFKLLTGKEGMGYGDFKLLAAIGALVGWQQLGVVIILSAGVGAIIGGAMIAFQHKDSQTKIPFGPYLAAAGWITFLWGDVILQNYLSLAGLK